VVVVALPVVVVSLVVVVDGEIEDDEIDVGAVVVDEVPTDVQANTVSSSVK